MGYRVEDVYVATPTRGQPNWNHVRAMYRLMAEYPGMNQPEMVAGGLSVTHGRNKLVQQFLQTDATILLFIDDDVVPRPHLFDMLQHLDTYDIVGAPYPMIHPPVCPIPTPCAFKIVKQHHFQPLHDIFILQGIQPCDAVGTGCMMIKRAVLENPKVMPFQLGVDGNGVMRVSEDILFCQRATEQEYTIGADFDQVADHLHTLSLNTLHLEYMKKMMKAIEIDKSSPSPSLIIPG